MLRTLSVILALALAFPGVGICGATTHTVMQVGFTFVPDDLTIQVGDTVEWEFTGGTHTVTNGTDSSDPLLGTLFDFPLNLSNPLQSYTFNDPGDVPYFCVIHEFFNQSGIIRVQGGVVSAPEGFEDSSWSRVKNLYR